MFRKYGNANKIGSGRRYRGRDCPARTEAAAWAPHLPDWDKRMSPDAPIVYSSTTAFAAHVLPPRARISLPWVPISPRTLEMDGGSLPPNFDLVPALHALLVKVLDPGVSEGYLSTKDIATVAATMKLKLQKARASLADLESSERTVAADDLEIQTLQAKIARQRHMLTNIATSIDMGPTTAGLPDRAS